MLLVVGNTLGLGSNSLELEKNNFLPVHPAFKLQSIQGSLGYDDIFLNDTFQFDINAHDVMVFLHIQKTGKKFSFFNKFSIQSFALFNTSLRE